ncbi:type II secretion system protein N [Novosphingobium sp. KCTC 2891]|uniref:type II secretion system protein N n=1 Tax=Novosphingobium sp. KCTC 2891 TaxID=2989730 RepID=UPI0022230BB1|nr:type II secretion system protein N [Novosphingobium sp. KCTC 2891]MCW1384033.1 type II secretion system protein N [Novosphingobium sp. KCTC 2891]
MIGRWIFLRDGRWPAGSRMTLALLFLAALVVLLPLRLVLGGVPGLSASAAEGTIWSGRVRDAAIGPFVLGTVDAGLSPLPLLVGRREVWLRRGGADPLHGRISGAGGEVRLSSVDGTVAPGGAFGGLPVEAINFAGFGAALADGRCLSAEGSVTATLPPLGALGGGPILLSGRARCDGAALLLPLRGSGGMERLDLRIHANGGWRAEFVLADPPMEAVPALVAMGFVARPGGLGLRTSGRLR